VIDVQPFPIDQRVEPPIAKSRALTRVRRQTREQLQIERIRISFVPPGRRADPRSRSREISDLSAGFAFLDDRRDLLVGAFAPFHSVLVGTEDLIVPVADQRGQVTAISRRVRRILGGQLAIRMWRRCAICL
jgi:hypothetical protein